MTNPTPDCHTSKDHACHLCQKALAKRDVYVTTNHLGARFPMCRKCWFEVQK